MALLLPACAYAQSSPGDSPVGRLGGIVEGGFVVPERPPVPPEVTVTIQEVPYPIDGSTVDELNASMRARSPFRDGPDRRGSDGYTAWNLRWDFRTIPSGHGCRLSDIRVTLSIETTTYRWTPPQGVSQALIAAVEEARTRLLAHEREHQTIDILGALDLVDMLREQSRTTGSCERLEEAVNAEGQRILEGLRSVNRTFDVVTKSGTVPPPGAG